MDGSKCQKERDVLTISDRAARCGHGLAGAGMQDDPATTASNGSMMDLVLVYRKHIMA